MADPFRVYGPDECGPDGYPSVWHRNRDGELDGLIDEMGLEPTVGVKHIVRAQAGNRCLRCRHPFIVGESGELEGPQHQAKALSAELGVNSEILDLAIEEDIEILPAEGLLKAPRTNWSACDEQCRHGGPVRARVSPERPWETREEDGPQFPLSQGNEAQAAWRILTVHHLDEIKANLRWWNLVALCQRCHLLIQRKVTMDQPWPWEHSDWFRPYAAAWYALKYLGEDLDRLQTAARLDELLELGKREESVERMPL